MRINNIYSLALAALLAASCSSDIADDTQKGRDEVKVSFNLRSRATSGVGVAADPVPALEVERFSSYWAVFTDGSASNKIVAIVKNNCELTEQDEFTVNLSPGTYKVYGFANIDGAYLESLGIVEGQNMPDLSGTLFTPDARFFGNGVTTLLPVETFQADYAASGNPGIPMTSSGGQTVNITNAVTVDASIEVVRMFAKVEFLFGNNTANDLTLRGQSISNLSVNHANGTGFIPLYNDDERTFSFLDGTPFKTLSYTYPDGGLQLAQGATNVSRAFYVLESKADELTNSFLLDFDVVKKGDAPADASDYMRYALTDESTLTAIRRNDWIRIPVVFTDWQMRLEALTYPPIGGYPEAEISELESNEFVVAFDGGGDFSIRPFIRKFGDADNWFGIDNTTRISGTPTITVDDTDGIFLTAPALTSTGEIRGRMKVASGQHATITVTAKVITSTTPLTTKTLTRKIYVTQK